VFPRDRRIETEPNVSVLKHAIWRSRYETFGKVRYRAPIIAIEMYYAIPSILEGRGDVETDNPVFRSPLHVGACRLGCRVAVCATQRATRAYPNRQNRLYTFVGLNSRKRPRCMRETFIETISNGLDASILASRPGAHLRRMVRN